MQGNREWPRLYEIEASYLREKLPESLIKRIEHFGSTAVPQLAAKPIVDILVEVSLVTEKAKRYYNAV